MESTEQIVVHPANEAGQDGLISGFFAVGMVVNVVLLIAYIAWAYKQWGKNK